MSLSFRSQFILVPGVIIITLACLVTYTLIALGQINSENDKTRQKIISADRVGVAIASTLRLIQLTEQMPATQNSPITQSPNELFFNYLEQTQIVVNSLLDSQLLEQLPLELRQRIKANEALLRNPEQATHLAVNKTLKDLLPALDLQNKIFAAQRRTAYIESHRQLMRFSSRLTTVLLSTLIMCILLAAALSVWGLYLIRRRLKSLVDRIAAVCAPDDNTTKSRDEIDDLELRLSNVTARLLNVVSAENLLHGAENERRRIARDMHDGILADLTTLNRQLDTLHADPSNQSVLSSMRTNLDATITDLRRTIDDLHPQVLEILGLESALQSYLARHSTARNFPEYHFEFDPSIEKILAKDHKLNLFRILAEAITNATKHAQCKRLEVCLRVLAQELLASVEDNGIGIAAERKTTGHGCANMVERARLMHAKVRWRQSRFATGTCFELSLAVPPPK